MAKNVFSNDPSGPEFVQEPMHFRPDVAVIFRAAALPGETKWLAGIPPGDDVNRSNCIAGQLPHVVENWNVRPMFAQDGLAKLVLLAKRHRLESTRTFKPKAETANPAEKVQDFEHVIPSPI